MKIEFNVFLQSFEAAVLLIGTGDYLRRVEARGSIYFVLFFIFLFFCLRYVRARSIRALTYTVCFFAAANCLLFAS